MQEKSAYVVLREGKMKNVSFSILGDSFSTYKVFTTKDGNRVFGPDGTDETNTNLNNATAVEGMKYF